MIRRGLGGDTAQPTPGTNSNQALKTLEKVLDEVEQSTVGSPTDSVDQSADSFNQPPTPVSSLNKEAKDPVNLDQVAADAARGAQQAELEPQPEIPPEVESYLQRVEDHQKTAPKEVVIADGSQTQPTDHQYPAEPVVVLPITQQEEQAGAKKSVKFSIRWLVEWSRKLMKVFAGKIVYRPIEESPA